jgi:hypothetical protein
MAQPLLSGHVDTSDQDSQQLEMENLELSARVRDLEMEIARTKRENARAIAALRQQLNPLYRALQAVFGEMDALGGSEAPESSSVAPQKKAVWEAWKQKLPGYPAKFIDALLLHGEMSGPQLRVVMQCATNTVYNVASQLNKLGLLGNAPKGRYKLKEL